MLKIIQQMLQDLKSSIDQRVNTRFYKVKSFMQRFSLSFGP